MAGLRESLSEKKSVPKLFDELKQNNSIGFNYGEYGALKNTLIV